jgi:mRNA interferase RelE/StbE
MYQIKLSKQAVKFLNKLNDPLLLNLKSKLTTLAHYPDCNLDIKVMKGEYKGYFRIRVGSIRVIFYPDDKSKIIYVDAINFRGDIY